MSPTDRYDTSQLVENQHEPGSHGRVLKNLLGIKRKRNMNRAEEIRFVRLMDQAVERLVLAGRYLRLGWCLSFGQCRERRFHVCGCRADSELDAAI